MTVTFTLSVRPHSFYRWEAIVTAQAQGYPFSATIAVPVSYSERKVLKKITEAARQAIRAWQSEHHAADAQTAFAARFEGKTIIVEVK